MSDIWTRARCAARDLRRRLVADNCVNAAAMIAVALADAELGHYFLPPGDGLLAGAHAVLDRESDAVWVRSDVPDALAAFLVAHELAHFHLHPEYSASQEYEGATDDETGEIGGVFWWAMAPANGAKPRRTLGRENCFCREMLPMTASWMKSKVRRKSPPGSASRKPWCCRNYKRPRSRIHRFPNRLPAKRLPPNRFRLTRRRKARRQQRTVHYCSARGPEPAKRAPLSPV